jgi:hypothetical protein
MPNEQPSNKPPLSKEDFLAWEQGQVSRLVLERLRSIAAAERSVLEEDLFNLSSFPPAEWAAKQVEAAYLRGRFEAFVSVADLTHEYLWPEEPATTEEKSE